MTTQLKWESKIRQELYKSMDSFLTESKNQDGVERSLEQLNKDRHLFVENMEKVIEDYLRKETWEQSCAGCGHHDSMWKSLVQSPQWKDWYEHASKNMLYDVDEAQEFGCMSSKHFQDFIDYILVKSKENYLQGIKEVWRMKRPILIPMQGISMNEWDDYADWWIKSFSLERERIYNEVGKMKKTEASKVDYRLECDIETYYEKMAYNYGISDAQNIIKPKE